MEAKTSTLESRLEKDHHDTSQQIQTLQENFQNRYETTQRDLQMIRTDLEHDLGKLGHSPAGFHLSEEKSCSTGKQSCELILHSSSKWLEKESPYMANKFFALLQ